MIVITNDVTELNVLQTALDYLKHSMLKDETMTEMEGKPWYINQCDAPELITMDHGQYDALMNMTLDWHLPSELEQHEFL